MGNIYNYEYIHKIKKGVHVKKISFISLLSALILPAFAESADVVDQYSQQFEQPIIQSDYSNPETKFPHGLQFGLGVSATSGLNGFIGYNNKNFESFWWKRFGFRLDIASYALIKDDFNKELNNSIGKEGIEIDKNLKITDIDMDAQHFGAIIDFYPFGDTWFLGGWRLSGGYMTGSLDIKSKIKANKDFEFELGGRKYQYTGGEMNGIATVNWNYSGPYLGTGFDLGLIAGLKMYFDAGVVFANNHSQVGLDVPLKDLKDITSGAPQDIQDEIKTKYEEAKAKALSDAQKELDKLEVYPLVKIGFMYRF